MIHSDFERSGRSSRAPLAVRIALLGAGVVGWLCGRRTVARLAAELGAGRVRAVVFDRAELRSDHLAHGDIYREGRPGEPKAAALARHLARLGVEVEARCGNLTRWPDENFDVDLAIVGLDDERARLAAHRRLRAAGVPTLVVGVGAGVSVHVLSSDPRSACYACHQGEIPLESTPCLPPRDEVSARAASAPAARALARDELPPIACAALRGRGLDRFLSFPIDGEAVEARLDPVAGCPGPHEGRPRARFSFRVDGETTLGEAFTVCAAALDAVPDELSLREGPLRLDYACPDCRTEPAPGDLIRRWPERERCPCGSSRVAPRLRLHTLSFAQARRERLLAGTLSELGRPPGGSVTLGRGAELVRLLLPLPVAGGSHARVRP